VIVSKRRTNGKGNDSKCVRLEKVSAKSKARNAKKKQRLFFRERGGRHVLGRRGRKKGKRGGGMVKKKLEGHQFEEGETQGNKKKKVSEKT